MGGNQNRIPTQMHYMLTGGISGNAPGLIIAQLSTKHSRIANATNGNQLRKVCRDRRSCALENAVERGRLEDHIVNSYVDDVHLVLSQSTRLVLECEVKVSVGEGEVN